MIYLDKNGCPINMNSTELAELTSYMKPSALVTQHNNRLSRIVAKALEKRENPNIIIAKAYCPRESKTIIPPKPIFFKRTSKKPTPLELSIMRARIKLKRKLNNKD